MKQLLIITAALIMCCTMVPLVSEELHSLRFPQALGFQTGRISGNGLSYHRWDGDIGYQVALGALYLPPGEVYSGNVLDYSIGAEIQRAVYGDNFSSWLSGRMYLFGGINHRGYIEKPIGSSSTLGPFTPVIGAGFGIGIEIILFEHFSFPVELGYGAFWRPTIANAADQFLIDLVPQAGFRYRY